MFSIASQNYYKKKMYKKWTKKQKNDQLLKEVDTLNLICYMIEVLNSV